MMSGGNILTLQKLLGHSSVAVTLKCGHLAPDFVRDEIARLRFERPAAAVTAISDLAARIERCFWLATPGMVAAWDGFSSASCHMGQPAGLPMKKLWRSLAALWVSTRFP
jgi:hypothetical protein